MKKILLLLTVSAATSFDGQRSGAVRVSKQPLCLADR